MHAYSPSIAREKYDCIVIGSGIGGLTAATLLAKEGKKVLVLERHYLPGGFSHTFKRQGYEWDVGVHYVGEVHRPEAQLRQVFDYLTDAKLLWEPMGEIYDRVVIANDTYDFVAGEENQIQKLVEKFPDDRSAIESYFSLLKKVRLRTLMHFGERSMPIPLSKYVGWILRNGFYKWSDQTTYEVLRRLTNNEKLISVLTAQCGDYGLPPKKSSFAMHALVAGHYLNGGSYPSGGASRIHHSILEEFTKYGGKLCLRAEVDQILLVKNKAVGVRLKNGDEIFSDKVISNAGARNTFERFLKEVPDKPFPILQQLKTIKPSISHFCAYVGLNRSDKDLNLPKFNYWMYSDYHFDSLFENFHLDPDAPLPFAYISFPSAKDPLWEESHPNQSTIQVLGMAPFEWFKKWDGTSLKKRGEDYEKFKEVQKQRLLNKLFEVVPQAKNHIHTCEFSTPLSTQHFSNYSSGEIYGLEHTPARFRMRWLRSHTPIQNLFMTGQDILTVGVGGAAFSGVVTASSILRKNLLGKIQKEASRRSREKSLQF